MRLILNITLAAEIVIALWWTVAMWTETGSSGIAVLGWFAVVLVAFAICFLIGAFVFWRRPSLRRRAAVVMAMPFMGGFAPYLLLALTGGPAGTDFVRHVAALALAVLLVAALLRPRFTAGKLPGLLFRSRGLNIAVVGLLALAWCALLVAVVWLLSGAGQDAIDRANRTSNGMATAYLVLGISAYLLSLGGGSVVSAAWGWLGLMGGVDGASRRIHIAQLVIAVPGILIAAVTWAFLLTQR